MKPALIGALDSPLPGARITGELSVHGWVTVTGGRLGKIEAILNGHSLGLLDLLQERPDVQLSLPETGRFSGFSGSFPVPRDQRQATAELEIRVTLMDGRELPLARLDLDVSPEQEEGPPRVLVWARGLEAGGSQLRMVEVVAQLCRIGAEVVVASPVEGDLRVALETCGARVEVVPAIPFGSILEYDSAVIDAASWAKPFAFDIVYSPTVTGFPAVEIAALIGARSWLRIGEYEPVSTVATWLHLPFVAEVELRARAAVKLADVVQTRDHATAARYRGMGWEGNFQIHREGTQIDLAPVAPGPRGTRPHPRVIGSQHCGSAGPVRRHAVAGEGTGGLVGGHDRSGRHSPGTAHRLRRFRRTRLWRRTSAGDRGAWACGSLLDPALHQRPVQALCGGRCPGQHLSQ